jgi:multiple sugar transport system permease protein
MFGLHARHLLQRILPLLAAVAVVLLMGFPLYAVVLTSLQPEEVIRSRDLEFFPSTLFLDHYREVFAPDHIVPIPRAMGNSLLIAAAAALLTVVVAMPATYALTRLPTPGRGLFLGALVSIYLLPTMLFVLPIYIGAVQLGLIDRHITIIILYVSFTLPLTIWALKGFLEAVPIEIEEAARLDGCNQFDLFFRIVVPLMRPGLLAALLMVFIMAWVEFLTPLLFTNRTTMLTVALGLYRSTRDIQIGQLAAAAVVTALPVVLLMSMFQRMLSRVILAGSDR